MAHIFIAIYILPQWDRAINRIWDDVSSSHLSKLAILWSDLKEKENVFFSWKRKKMLVMAYCV